MAALVFLSFDKGPAIIRAVGNRIAKSMLGSGFGSRILLHVSNLQQGEDECASQFRRALVSPKLLQRDGRLERIKFSRPLCLVVLIPYLPNRGRRWDGEFALLLLPRQFGSPRNEQPGKLALLELTPVLAAERARVDAVPILSPPGTS